MSDATTRYFTPAGSTATVLFTQTVSSTPASTPTDAYLTGSTDSWSAVTLAPDRASAATFAKVDLYHSAAEAGSIDLYIVERGVALADDAVPAVNFIGYGLPSGTAPVAAGSYDVYLTEPSEKTVLGGPFELDVTSGDVIFLLAYDDDLNPGSVIIENVSLP